MSTLFENKNGLVSKIKYNAKRDDGKSVYIVYNLDGFIDKTDTNITALVSNVATTDSTRDNIVYDCDGHIYISTGGAAVGQTTIRGLLFDSVCKTTTNQWIGKLRKKYNKIRVGSDTQRTVDFYPELNPNEKIELLLNSLHTDTSKNASSGVGVSTFQISGYMVPEGYKSWSP